MNKAFSNFQWENDPSVNTPISAENLNKVNNALNEVDNRVVSHDTTKANQTEMLTAFTDVALDEKTGKFTFTRHNGTKVVLDTKLEKLILNWRFDFTAQILHLILEDGSEMPIDLSAFITNYEFVDSTTIRAVIGTDGKVAFEIINGTITGSKLEPNYLANIQVEATKASASATSAELSAQNAESSAVRAEKAAEDAQAAVGGDYATNSRVDDIVSGATTVGNAEKLDGHDSDYFAKNEDLANYLPKTGGHVTGNIYHRVESATTLVDRYTNSVVEIQFGVWSDGFRGLYDSTSGKNIIRLKPDGTMQIDGNNTPLHSGNSAKVAIQSSAPTDTSALWVY